MSDLEHMLRQYLLEEKARLCNRLSDLERAYWWYGFDVFSTFEVLEAKIAIESFDKFSNDLNIILSLFG